MQRLEEEYEAVVRQNTSYEDEIAVLKRQLQTVCPFARIFLFFFCRNFTFSFLGAHGAIASLMCPLSCPLSFAAARDTDETRPHTLGVQVATNSSMQEELEALRSQVEEVSARERLAMEQKEKLTRVRSVVLLLPSCCQLSLALFFLESAGYLGVFLPLRK